MAGTLLNLTINGNLTSNNLSPYIAGFRPTLHWEYDGTSGGDSQKTITIRIGNSYLNLGLDAFVGNILDITKTTTTNSYIFDPNLFTRGLSYYGQIQIIDNAGSSTIWYSFRFKINHLPVVSNISILPSSPSPLDNLDLSYTYFDPDGHDEIASIIRWFNHNIPQAEFDGLKTLPSSVLRINDSWHVRVIPYDGIEYGFPSESESVVITNSEIVFFEKIELLPTDANVDDIIKINYTLSQNEYFTFNGTVKAKWYINNELALDELGNSFEDTIVRLKLIPGDIVFAILELIDNYGNTINTTQTTSIVISDVNWHIENMTISGKISPQNLTDTSPFLEWEAYKTTASESDFPTFVQVIITKTKSLSGAIYDTGIITYTTNSFSVPSGILQKGESYFIHVGIGDSDPIDNDLFETQFITLSGSSWSLNVENEIGWTIEFKIKVISNNAVQDTITKLTDEPNLGVSIHDGTYSCLVNVYTSKIIFMSDSIITWDVPSGEDSFSQFRTIRISGKNTDIIIFVDNVVVINALNKFTRKTSLKTLEYGDFDTKWTNQGIFQFLRYATKGPYDISPFLEDKNNILFHTVGNISGGSFIDLHKDLAIWTPYDSLMSSKLIKVNDTSDEIFLRTTSINSSAITSIFIDQQRNKYIGTASGIVAIYGDKHSPDYSFTTDQTITSADFDRVTSLSSDMIVNAESTTKTGWFTIDTTHSAIGEITSEVDGDPYLNTYSSHAIHYYSQRVSGHSWFDNVDNKKGWQASFGFKLDTLEQSDFNNEYVFHHGFGMYINDGTYQEIIYFYPDRIRLYYANVYIPLSTTLERQYRIVGKDKNIFVYQKLLNAPNGSDQLLIDGSGLFVTPASKSASSEKPKTEIDSDGNIHTVWHDDGDRDSKILYSYYSNNVWSVPEIVDISNVFNLRNPSITIDSTDRIWIAYEDSSFGGNTEISVSVKDNFGWNRKTRITRYTSDKFRPSIKSDNNDAIHLIWEDNRNGLWEILSATWNSTSEAWISSNYYEYDIPIMSSINQNPYVAIDFRNAKLSYAHPYLWVISEGEDKQTGNSSIYAGILNVTTGVWTSEGAPVFDDSGTIIGFSSGLVVSQSDGIYVNPNIAASSISGQTAMVWEGLSGNTRKIWSAVYQYSGFTEILSDQIIINQPYNCIKPVVGWSGQKCTIACLAEIQTSYFQILIAFWNSSTNSFFSSNISGYDQIITLPSTSVGSCSCLNLSTDSSSTYIVYDFVDTRISSEVDVSEYPKTSIIGSVKININASDLTDNSLDYDTENLVSSLDTKEFAFGDFSESVGIKARWKDFSMYFGYDSRPYSITSYNNSSVTGWTDNRINDLFVDVFGNIIAATYNSLLYYRTSNNTILNIPNFSGLIVTAIKWGKNGIWHAGTSDGAYYTSNAGKDWLSYVSTVGYQINSIDVSSDGLGIIGTDNGIFVVNPVDGSLTARINSLDDLFVRVVKIDENNIIWAGTNSGIYRIENYSYVLKYNSDNGMRSSYVTDISIVNKYLRYIGTPTGIERMYGTRFINLNVKTNELINDNISALLYYKDTKSLWAGINGNLHEIIFRDEAHEVIENETVIYSNEELDTPLTLSRSNFYLLDSTKLSINESSLQIDSESAQVYVNKNPIDFGYSIDPTNFVVKFDCNLLASDTVEIKVSNVFTDFYDFTQSSIEEKIDGFKRTAAIGITSTSAILPSTGEPQYLVLTNDDKNSVSVYAGESRLPFTTIMIDKDPPFGCLEFIEAVTPSTLKFKVIADDTHSGISGFLLSNYSNLTSDGTIPLDYKPLQTIVTHDIGGNLNNVITFLEIPSTCIIDGITYSVGVGSCLTSRIEQVSGQSGALVEYLYLATSYPAIIFKYDPTIDMWTSLQILDVNDPDQKINKITSINNVLYVITGSDNPLNTGAIYRSIDGLTFSNVSSISGSQNVLCLTSASDGTIYFGTDSGSVYKFFNNTLSLLYNGIESSISGIEIFNQSLLLATGNKGRVYLADLSTNNISIIFDSDDTNFSNILIKDKEIITQDSSAIIYLSSGSSNIIYRGVLSEESFNVSYKSTPAYISKIGVLNTATINTDPTQNPTDTIVIASIGKSLFKHTSLGWEFFYGNDEKINDFTEYSTSSISGVFLVSDTKITKWTNVLSSKTVYLSLKDKAGNISGTPDTIPCSVYQVNINDLQGFVNESRIIHVSNATNSDINEYSPQILFSYNSPNGTSFFSADQIDEEVGIYTSEIFNGSNELVSWKSISWISDEPENTTVAVQYRSSAIESEIIDQSWSNDLIKNSRSFVTLENVTDQFIQIRVILTSKTRNLSPTLTSVTLRNITTKSTHFFTTNFVLPSRPIKGLLTSNTFIPVSADIIFGIDTNDSVDFSSYQIIESERIFTTGQNQIGSNIKVGIKLLSPSLPGIPTPVEYGSGSTSTYSCAVNFNYKNESLAPEVVHFRMKFYSSHYRTDDVLIYTFFSGNDQYGWEVDNIRMPSIGTSLASGSSVSVRFTPNELVVLDELFYLTIEVYDGTSWTVIDNTSSYSCETCFTLYQQGLYAEFYKNGIAEEIDHVPSFSGLDPDFTLYDSIIDFPALDIASEWVTSDGTSLPVFILFAVRWKGLIYIPETGSYKFSLESDDGSILYIDDDEVVNNDGLHDVIKITSDYITLAQGYHRIEVHYFQRYGNKELHLRWTRPGYSEAIIPSNNLFHNEVSEYCISTVPKVYDFIIVFELENGERIKINV